MTKKNYILIANVIRGYSVSDHNLQVAKPLAENLAYELEQDNPAFDRNKFLTACGIEA